VECAQCGTKLSVQNDSYFCSEECKQALADDFELYLDWYNDYMSGYDVPSFEKISKKRKPKEEA